MSFRVSFDFEYREQSLYNKQESQQKLSSFRLVVVFVRSLLSKLTIKLTTFFLPHINCLRQLGGNVHKTTENFKLASGICIYISHFTKCFVLVFLWCRPHTFTYIMQQQTNFCTHCKGVIKSSSHIVRKSISIEQKLKNDRMR